MPRTVVITGCSTGFGRLAALRLARTGDRVYATMRGVQGKNREKAEALETTAESEGIDLRVLELDVTSSESVDAAAQTVISESGAPDVVVNNAGQMFMGLTEAFTAEELTRQLEVNVIGIHRMCRAFLPAMREQGAGLVINIGSTAGRVAVPFFAVYHCSKWALEGYSLGLRGELASSGVDLVIVEPGPFTTELFPSGPGPEDAEARSPDCPEALHEAHAGMGAAFEQMFASDEVPTDPELVVDRIGELIEMQPGTRPARSVVGSDFGVVRELNRLVEPLYDQLWADMGLAEVASIKPPS